MFKHNPFVLIPEYLQANFQRFVLYMLDHYGILVSKWAIYGVHLTLAYVIYRKLVVKPFQGSNGEIGYLLIAGIVISILYTITFHRYSLEKAKKYTLFNNLNGIWKSIIFQNFVLVILALSLSIDIKELMREISLGACFEIFYDIYNTSFVFFMGCYTRDREPPAKTSMTYSPV